MLRLVNLKNKVLGATYMYLLLYSFNDVNNILLAFLNVNHSLHLTSMDINRIMVLKYANVHGEILNHGMQNSQYFDFTAVY